MRKIAGRATTVKTIDATTAKQFLEEHHRQGSAKPGKRLRSYGLYHGEELVAVMSLCTPRTKGKQAQYTTEILRLAFKKDVRVMGGGSKLIRHAMKVETLWDLFTYQDSSGENTEIYAHAGMTLVQKAKPKKILVKNGLTKDTAQDNMKDWLSFERAVSLGPDKLLGIRLGTVLRPDGTPKSNIELFTEDCGYHIEEVPGDSVYAWHNPDVNFYLYKITSSVDDNYYIGRRRIYSQAPSFEECLKDRYMGSGGIKFKNWVEAVGPDNLEKTVLRIEPTWEKIVKAEMTTVGDLWKEDPHCMNSSPGGPGGITAVIVMKKCSTHGETLFNGDTCMKCSALKKFSMLECAEHGMTAHRSGKCDKCRQPEIFKEKTCEVHGKTMFKGPRCLKCIAQENFTLKNCAKHGMVLHYGDTCATCSSQKSVGKKECPLHGFVTHQGNTCSKCTALKAVSERECPKHGVTVFQGEHCMKCNAEGQLSERECEVHGLVTHKGSTCTRCTAAKSVALKECSKHGLVKHQGDVCSTCHTESLVTEAVCVKHGRVKHQGGKCCKCTTQALVVLGECEVHGTSKFQGGACSKCRNASLVTVRECVKHGKAKHRGKSCYQCMTERRRAKAAAKKAASGGEVVRV